jgi:nucleotide-binding universal stress UspA family protein
MVDVRKILCPIDFSEHSRQALRMAVDLARRFGAELTLLHVYQMPGYFFPEGVVLAGPDVMRDLTERVERTMAEWRADASAMGIGEVHTQTAMGATSPEIVRTAEDGKFDLICIGTHGRTGLKHALLGSVAERVVRTAKVPVLTVRSLPEHEHEHEVRG